MPDIAAAIPKTSARTDATRKRDREYYLKNREKKLKAAKAYRIKYRHECSKRSQKYYRANHDAKLEYHKKYRTANKAKLRERELVRNYGATMYELNELILLQNGLCAICHKKKRLVVDHSHKHGANVRGLLCNHCNVGLGMFQDNPSVLLSAISYLKGSINE